MSTDSSSAITANQLWKSSGTTLDFKDWLTQEKDKNAFIKNDTLASILEESKNDTGVNLPAPNLKSSNKILGINKTVLAISALVIVGAIAYKYYKK